MLLVFFSLIYSSLPLFTTFTIFISITRNNLFSIHFSYISFVFSFLIGNCLLGTYIFLNLSSSYFIFSLINILLAIIVVSFWINDLNIEFFIYLTNYELIILYFGFKLFILSELMIFLSLFSSFINYILLWYFYFFIILYAIPFSNLLILLYSSFAIQSSLIFIKLGFLLNLIEGLSQTISTGFLFLTLQFKEFLFSFFTYSNYSIGSIIYSTTGLHGLHVIIGLFLLLSFLFYLLLFYHSSHFSSHSS